MRYIFMLMMAVMLVLSACSSGQSGSKDSKSGAQGDTAGQSDQKATDDGQTDQTNGKEDKEATGEKGEQQEGKQQEKQETEANKHNDTRFVQKKPKYEMTKNYYIKPIGDADPKVVLLTIDDAPEDHAVDMAKTLRKLDAKAIFYVNKIYVDKDNGKKKVKKLFNMGFPIGNHTVTHPNLSDLSKDEQRKELVPLYDQIKKLTGEEAEFFRAPHGINTDVSNEEAKKRGVLAMNWSYGYDFHEKYEDPKALTEIMLKPDPPGLLQNGAILLMHDRDWTNKALADIVKGLRDKGYKILDPALLKTPQSPK